MVNPLKIKSTQMENMGLDTSDLSQKLEHFKDFKYAVFGQTLHSIHGKFYENDIWLFGDAQANFQLWHTDFYPKPSLCVNFS